MALQPNFCANQKMFERDKHLHFGCQWQPRCSRHCSCRIEFRYSDFDYFPKDGHFGLLSHLKWSDLDHVRQLRVSTLVEPRRKPPSLGVATQLHPRPFKDHQRVLKPRGRLESESAHWWRDRPYLPKYYIILGLVSPDPFCHHFDVGSQLQLTPAHHLSLAHLARELLETRWPLQRVTGREPWPDRLWGESFDFFIIYQTAWVLLNYAQIEI